MSEHQSEEALFAAALQCAGDERAACLDRGCAGDAEMRQRLEARLSAHEQAPTAPEKPKAPAPPLNPAIQLKVQPEAEVAQRIGRYKLLQKIGEGGCGVVHMAEQEEPVRRRVALKVIKPGMDTKQVLARFEAERQALALMDHPNIAKVFDGGATESGRPFFVMELVKGIRITEYCDENKLSTQDRLALFSQVCQAIQHAHQKGIIHRDIKPSNILVADHDGVPVPKVIDFGIAKATTDQRLTDKTLFTALEQFIGTPAYMSPEQARMSGLDIDTRSDIYSLGVLLYELLTGKTPFDTKRLLEAGFDEIRRIIREEEPPRPSTRLSTLDATEQSIVAQRRHSEPPKLLGIIRGDLDWIVMKCLEKDRQRRYETANGLASDIQRHLSNEPVIARPPSAGYRFQKMIRRNKSAFFAVACVATVLILGVILITWQAVRATRAEREKNFLFQKAQSAQADEVKQRQRAEAEEAASREKLVRLYLANGTRLLEDEDYFGALVWFTEALMVDKGNPSREEIHRMRLGSVFARTPILQQNWFQNMQLGGSHFSPDGNRVVTYNSHWGVRVWDAATGRAITPYLQNQDSSQNSPVENQNPENASFSVDGRMLVTGGYGEVRVWDSANGRPIGPSMKFDCSASHLSFSPDGTRVVAGGRNPIGENEVHGDARIWNFVTGQATTPLLNHSGEVLDAFYSPGGAYLVTASRDYIKVDKNGTRIFSPSELRAWDAVTGRAFTPPWKHDSHVIYAAFSPHGDKVVTVSNDRTARLWDALTGAPLTPSLQHSEDISTAEFSPDGLKVVTGGRYWREPSGRQAWDVVAGTPITTWSRRGSNKDDYLMFWPDNRLVQIEASDNTRRISDALTGEMLVPFLKVADFAPKLVFQREGHRFIVRGRHNNAQLWDLAAERATSWIFEHRGPVMKASFSSDGERIVTASWDGTARVWDATSGEPATPSMRIGSGVTQASFSSDGKLILTACADGTAQVWDSRTGRPISPVLRHRHTGSMAASFSPDCQRVLTSSGNESGMGGGEWHEWDALTGRHLLGHSEIPNHLDCSAFSPDGKQIVTAGGFGAAQTWDADTGKAISQPMAHRNSISSASFSPDGTLILTASLDATARVWKAATGTMIGKEMKHDNALSCASFSPDGRRVVTSCWDGTARVWDVGSSEPLTPPLRHVRGGVAPVCFSPNGRLIVTGGEDKSARVWEVATGAPVTPPLKHSDSVVDVGFSPDGRRVITASRDGTARLWNLPLDKHPVEDLVLMTQLLSSRQLDSTGSLVPLDDESMRKDFKQVAEATKSEVSDNSAPSVRTPSAVSLSKAWESLHSKYPGDFVTSAKEALVWHRREAVNLQFSRQWSSSIFHLNRLIDAEPLKWRHYANRARAQAEQEAWSQAANDFSKALELGADDDKIWFERAKTALALHDMALYRTRCADLVERFRRTEYPLTANDTVWACVLVRDPIPDLVIPLRLSEQAVASHTNANYLATLGAVLYRSGSYEAAIVQLNKAIAERGTDGITTDWIFLSMAHHRLGRVVEARQWLAKAASWIEKTSQRMGVVGSDQKSDWQERLESETLYGEATKMLADAR